jgi:histidyl-tRNA synthetase
MERIILHIEEEQGRKSKAALVAYQNQDIQPHAVALARELWEKGYTANIVYGAKNMKKQFKYGDRINASFTFVLGEDELSNNTVSIKNMETKEQITIKKEELEQWLEKNM